MQEEFELRGLDSLEIGAQGNRTATGTNCTCGDQNHPSNLGHASGQSNHILEEQLPPDDASPDVRPSRRYQIALLICGFLMIFQVIGINSVYGVFQVCFSFHL